MAAKELDCGISVEPGWFKKPESTGWYSRFRRPSGRSQFGLAQRPEKADGAAGKVEAIVGALADSCSITVACWGTDSGCHAWSWDDRARRNLSPSNDNPCQTAPVSALVFRRRSPGVLLFTVLASSRSWHAGYCFSASPTRSARVFDPAASWTAGLPAFLILRTAVSGSS